MAPDGCSEGRPEGVYYGVRKRSERRIMTEMQSEITDAAAWVRRLICKYTASKENDLHLDGGHEPAWAEPLVGFSCGGDPLYRKFKDDIGPFLWTPPEIFALTFPDIKIVRAAWRER